MLPVFLLALFALPVFILIAVYYTFLLPPKYPLGIPAVPFWVVLIPFFKDVDQSETFRQYIQTPLRTHGTVKIFFGARWNLLVHRPAYLAEIFKNEDQWQKSGNQKKIPHSVLAAFLGDNIISARAEVWKTYRSIINPPLQRDFDASIVQRNAGLLCDRIALATAQTGNGVVAMQELLQRYTIANTTEVILDTEMHALDHDPKRCTMNTLQSQVKREIFQPIFMNFPFLDRLGLKSRQKAWDAVAQFRNHLRDSVTGSHEKAQLDIDSEPDRLAARLLKARREGILTEKQFMDNLTVLFVASQENPQLALISALYLLAKNPESQAKILAEARTTTDPTAPSPYLTSIILESVRLFPPIGQLINRRAATSALLGGTLFVPAGTYLGYNCHSTNRDPSVWGPSADAFIPERWGATPAQIHKELRTRKARAEFISFHGGKRACLGEKFTMLVMRVTLVELVRRFEWELDPAWVDRKTPAGPLYPRALQLRFAPRDRTGEKCTAGATT